MKAKNIGVTWELAAERYLVEYGLQPLCRNFHCRLGEIDLIMDDSGTLVFIEVRYRKNQTHGTALASVVRTKQLKICRAAGIFLSRRPSLASRPCRFDVVGMRGSESQPRITWVKNAFDAGG